MRLWRPGGGAGTAGRGVLGGLFAKQHHMEELEEEEFGETDNGKKDETEREKKRNVFLISAKWDQVERRIILVKVLCVDAPLSFLI